MFILFRGREDNNKQCWCWCCGIGEHLHLTVTWHATPPNEQFNFHQRKICSAIKLFIRPVRPRASDNFNSLAFGPPPPLVTWSPGSGHSSCFSVSPFPACCCPQDTLEPANPRTIIVQLHVEQLAGSSVCSLEYRNRNGFGCGSGHPHYNACPGHLHAFHFPTQTEKQAMPFRFCFPLLDLHCQTRRILITTFCVCLLIILFYLPAGAGLFFLFFCCLCCCLSPLFAYQIKIAAGTPPVMMMSLAPSSKKECFVSLSWFH